MRERLRRLFKPRFAVLYPLVIWALVFAYPTDDSLRQGLWFILPGLLTRGWANLYAVKMEKLTTCGPYAHLRHPLYFGSFLIMFGFLVMLNIHWLAATACLGIMAGVVYNITVTNEDKMLKDKFGQQYADYKRKVPAFFPALRPYKGGSKWGPSMERYFRSQEYKLFLWVAIFIIFFHLKQRLLIEKEGLNAGKIILISAAAVLAMADVAGEFFRKKRNKAA
jgi:hypothetical protein